MADKLFTLHIVILNHPAALPDAAEQPLVTGRNGSTRVYGRPSCRRRAVTGQLRKFADSNCLPVCSHSHSGLSMTLLSRFSNGFASSQ
jgi:hypothetical protein